MKCPSCRASISPWLLWRMSAWKPLQCPHCGALADRRSLWMSAMLFGIVYGVTGWFIIMLDLQGSHSWVLLLFLVIVTVLWSLIDSWTIQLIPADLTIDRRRVKRRALAWMVSLPLLMPLFVFPVTLYVFNTIPTDCRDWALGARQSRLALACTQNPKERYYILTQASKEAVELRRYGTAQRWATELLAAAPQFRRDWNYGNAIHDGHATLGRIALARGDRETARRELLQAGMTPGSPQLDSFGPNMSLAREMLRAGELQTVLRYFDECDRFWDLGHSKLNRWRRLARWHLPPDFGANLLF